MSKNILGLIKQCFLHTVRKNQRETNDFYVKEVCSNLRNLERETGLESKEVDAILENLEHRQFVFYTLLDWKYLPSGSLGVV